MQINRYTRQVMIERKVADTVNPQAIGQAGEVLSIAADLTGKIAKKMNDTTDSMWLTETLAKKTRSRIDMEQQERLNFTDNPEGYSGYVDKKMVEFDNEAVKLAPSENARETYRQAALKDNINIYEGNKNWENKASIDASKRKADAADTDLNDSAYALGASDQPLDPEILNQNTSKAVGLNAIMSPEQVAIYESETRKEKYDKYAQGLAKANPNKAIKELENYKAITENVTFDDAVKSIFDMEGGYVEDDAGKGATMYGVNSSANPVEFAEIMRLEQEGKPDLAKSLAKQTYKIKYWDAINADKLDPRLAYVAVDASVNMGVGATKEMLAQADGDIGKFLDLRRSRYQSIAANNPEKEPYLKGWLNRVDMLEDRLDGGVLPQERIDELNEKAQIEIKKNQAEYRQVFNQEMDTVEKTAALGIKIPDTKLNEMSNKAMSNGLDEEYKAIQTFKKTQNAVIDFVKKPMSEQKSEFLAMQETIKSGDMKKVNEYEAISKAFEQKIKAVNDSPLDYYASADVINPVNPVDFANPAQMTGELTSRRASIQLIKEKDGVSAPLLTTGEIDKIKEIYNTGQPKEVSQVISSIGANLNSEERRLLALKMKDAPVLAAAMAQEDVKVTEKILSGSKIEKAKVGIDKIAPVIYQKLGSAVTDPAALNSTLESVYAYYKYSSLQAGLLDSDTVDTDRLDDAIANVVGQVGSVTLFGNSSSVIIPKNMDVNQFEDVFDSVDDALLMETTKSAMFSNNGDVLDTESALSLGVFRTVGDGKYSLLIDGDKVLDKNGNDYIFDVQKLKDTALKMGRLRTISQDKSNVSQSFYNPIAGVY